MIEEGEGRCWRERKGRGYRRMPLLQMWEEEDGGGDEMVVVLVQLSSLPTHYSPTDLHRFTFDKIHFFV